MSDEVSKIDITELQVLAENPDALSSEYLFMTEKSPAEAKPGVKPILEADIFQDTKETSAPSSPVSESSPNIVECLKSHSNGVISKIVRQVSDILDDVSDEEYFHIDKLFTDVRDALSKDQEPEATKSLISLMGAWGKICSAEKQPPVTVETLCKGLTPSFDQVTKDLNMMFVDMKRSMTPLTSSRQLKFYALGGIVKVNGTTNPWTFSILELEGKHLSLMKDFFAPFRDHPRILRALNGLSLDPLLSEFKSCGAWDHLYLSIITDYLAEVRGIRYDF